MAVQVAVVVMMMMIMIMVVVVRSRRVRDQRPWPVANPEREADRPGKQGKHNGTRASPGGYGIYMCVCVYATITAR